MMLWQDLQGLWPHLSTQRRRALWGVLGLMLLGALAELVSMGAIVPFITTLVDPKRAQTLPLVAPLLQWLHIPPEDFAIWMSLGFGLVVVVAALLRLWLLWAANRLVYGLGHDLSVAVYSKTLRWPYDEHTRRNSSDILGGVIKTQQISHLYLMPLMSALVSLVLASGILVMLLWIDTWVALTGALVFALSYLLIALTLRKRMSVHGTIVAKTSDQRLQEMQEGLGGIREVILGGLAPTLSERFARIDQALSRSQASQAFLAVSPRFAVEGVGLLIIALFAVHAAGRGDGLAQLLPVLGALGLGAQKLMPLVQLVYAGWMAVTTYRASLHDVLALLNAPEPGPQKALPPLRFEQAIRLEGVGFAYRSAPAQAVLSQVDLVLPKGMRLGITGTTGGGKSTLVDLIMGLLSPTQGQIRIDDQALDHPEAIAAWQQQVAHVPQSIYLSDASVAENIALGRADGEPIDWARLRRAADIAQLSPVIEQLPQGHDTQVGERGVRLSGGQRQRLGIARALYRQSQVLVLDEATSALDTETEQRVMDGIYRHCTGMTLLIIAHRLSTLSACDLLIRVDQGRCEPMRPEQA
jgi:ABC-type multidrug transport system fused ATPase/permease subunit